MHAVQRFRRGHLGRHAAVVLVTAFAPVAAAAQSATPDRIDAIERHIRQLEGEDSASLVRGTDRFHHFAPEPRPDSEMAPDMMALHKRIAERSAQILYRGTGIASFNDPQAVRG